MNSIWNYKQEFLNKEEIEIQKIQNLVKTLQYVSENESHYYNGVLRNYGIPTDIEYLLKNFNSLPLTEYSEFNSEYSEFINYNYNSRLRDNFIKNECISRGLMMAGLNKFDVVENCFNYGLDSKALDFHTAAENIGITVVPVSNNNYIKQLTLMVDLECSSMFADTNYLKDTKEKIQNLSQKDRLIYEEYKNLNSIICTVDNLSDMVRKDLEQYYSSEIFAVFAPAILNNYVIAAECHYHHGLHINEDYFYCEVLNPETKEKVNENESGELVITSLSNDFLNPFIRLRTGYIVEINHETCNCNRQHSRLQF